MSNRSRELFSDSEEIDAWISGKPIDNEAKVLLTITDTQSEKTVLITNNEVISCKANLFVEAPAERIAVKGKTVFQKFYSSIRIAGYSLSALVIIFSLLSFTGLTKARIVLSGSMEPAISAGDIIITTPPSKKLPQVGDIVAYEARRFNGDVVGIFSHRIIDGDAETGFIVKGDNNKAPDTQKPTLGDISGVVIFIIPYIGTFLTRRALFIIIPTLIGLWLVMDAMKNAE